MTDTQQGNGAERWLAMRQEFRTEKRGSAHVLVPQSFQEYLELAKIMSTSNMVPKDYRGKVEDCFVAMMFGAELGVSPMQALQNIAVINGRPSIFGDMALALVRAHPELTLFDEHYDEKLKTATCTVQRGRSKPVARSFSWAQAEEAGLTGRNPIYKQYPERMLRMRARSFALRDTFPDVLKGVHVAEESMDLPSLDLPSHRVVEANDLGAVSAPSPSPVTEDSEPLADGNVVRGRRRGSFRDTAYTQAIAEPEQQPLLQQETKKTPAGVE